MDSISFISFIVEIEENFLIELPDEYLDIDKLSSIYGFSNLIEELLEKKKNETSLHRH